jgi:probable FeS assembly SUF system protein SufT
MQNPSATELTRDCHAVQIPVGTPVVLPAGTAIQITQSLGGSYTIHADGGLYRVSSRDADALGLEPEERPSEPRRTDSAGSAPAGEEEVWTVLKTCYDPEIPVNIVDLGLVYDLQIEPLPSGRSRIGVKMTLTAPGCGMGSVIAADAQQKLLELPEVEEANVEIVWDPPWHHSMISPAGRAKLGLE